MSLLSLLVISGLVAAVAFFLAGFLLRPPRGSGADPGKQTRPHEVSENEIERLQEEQRSSEAALAQAKTECNREAEKRALAERERDSTRAEADRLSAKERILAERLHVAEDENRAAFEREEKQAEAWGAQLQASKAGQKRQDHALHEELEQLRGKTGRHEAEQALLLKDLEQLRGEAARQEVERARLVEERDQSEAERDRLIEESDRHQARARELEQSLEELRARSQQQVKDAAQECERLHGVLLAAEKRERAMLARLAEGETLDQDLAIRLRALEEAIEQEREQGKAAADAQRAAEHRLADLDRLVQENSELREQQAESVREAKWQAGRGDEAKDVKVELAAAQAKLVELGRTLEENRKLRDEAAELRQHQEASSELDRLTAAHKQLRLDAELMARRLQELMQDRGELVSLRAQAAEAASLVDELAYLRRREKDLEAQLYASGLYASREMPAVSGELLMQTPVSNMETNLHSLVGAGGPRTAVLADAQGFLIASAGESSAQEGLAAFAAVAGEMVSRARMLLPLAEVDSVRVTDRNSTVLTCHLFDSAGEGLGIATLGPGEAEAGNTARAIVELAAIVSGVEPAADPEPA